MFNKVVFHIVWQLLRNRRAAETRNPLLVLGLVSWWLSGLGGSRGPKGAHVESRSCFTVWGITRHKQPPEPEQNNFLNWPSKGG